MTKDDIIELAKEAGALVSPGISSADVTFSPAALERFYNLVSAAKQEACAELCDDMVLYTGYDCAASIRSQS